jgi:hypothetical protein
MPNEFNVTKPLLIGGAGRSGTTWVLEWLSKVPTLQPVIENSLAYVTYQQLCSSWWSEIFQKVECSEQKEIQWEKAVKAIRGMLCEVFPSRQTHWAMKIIWGVESTWGVPLEFWQKLFPDARYIHCTRDPLTCIPSIVRYLGDYSGCRTIPEAEQSFIRGNRDMLKLKAAGVPYLALPLEEIAQDPGLAFRSLLAFCGLEGFHANQQMLEIPIAAGFKHSENRKAEGGAKLRWSDLTERAAEIARDLGYNVPPDTVFRWDEAHQVTASDEFTLLSRIEALATENNELRIKLNELSSGNS